MPGTLEPDLGSARGKEQFNDAYARCVDAARRAPSDPVAHASLGHLLVQAERFPEAIACYARALALRPNYVDAFKGMAMAQARMARFREAEACINRWLAIAPDSADAHCLLSDVLVETNRYEQALAAAQRAVELHPDEPRLQAQVGRLLAQLDRPEEALEKLLEAKRQAPDQADIRTHLGDRLTAMGRFEEAQHEFHEAVRLEPGHSNAIIGLANIHRFAPGDALISEMERTLADAPPPSAAMRLHFALGKAYDDLGEVASAFRNFRAANEISQRVVSYDESATLSQMAQMARTFSAERMEQLRGGGAQSQMPIFILGMPRSGSTLVEQILVSHPKVAPGGELNNFMQAVEAAFARRTAEFAGRDYLTSLAAEDTRIIGEEYLARIAPMANNLSRVTDKLPANAVLVGLIHLALPQAKIIHTVRDPVDTCFSCYTRAFGWKVPYASDLGSLGRFYRQLAALMDHWHKVLPSGTIIDVTYEDVVADLEGQARRIVQHCGLEWDSHCLAFHETDRSVETASARQVRQPIYHSSVARHRSYRQFLDPLLTALAAPPVW